MKIPMRMKRIGWIGDVKGKPCFDRVSDEYSDLKYVPAGNVYRSKKEAKKRFEKIIPVYIPVLV